LGLQTVFARIHTEAPRLLGRVRSWPPISSDAHGMPGGNGVSAEK
jgi:hypothetical protein